MSGPPSLAGRTALVAGATGPIGSAVCTALAELGALVAVHYHRRGDVAAALASRLGDGHVALGGDATDSDELAAIVQDATARVGPVGILVNAMHPANSAPSRVAELGREELGQQLRAVEAHAALCAAVVPTMRSAGWGRVVYISGALMARPAPGFGAYGAAKAAASVLTRYLALEEGRSGITANIVAPGRVVDPADDTPLTPERQELAARLRERMALSEFPTPNQVAAVVAQLVAPAGDAVTGQTIWVTGGEPISA